MKAIVLIVLGVLIGYQMGKVAARRSENSFETNSDSADGRGKRIAGLAAAASMAAMHRVKSSAARS